MLRDDEIAAIQEETGFTPNQIERLYSRFTSLDKGDNGFLCREDFHRIPELAINPLGSLRRQFALSRVGSLFCFCCQVIALSTLSSASRELKISSTFANS